MSISLALEFPWLFTFLVPRFPAVYSKSVPWLFHG